MLYRSLNRLPVFQKPTFGRSNQQAPVIVSVVWFGRLCAALGSALSTGHLNAIFTVLMRDYGPPCMVIGWPPPSFTQALLVRRGKRHQTAHPTAPQDP